MPTVLHGHPGPGRIVKAVALVASDNFSARYDLDRQRGIFSRPSHALFGQSYVGKVLVLNTAKGGVASAWMIREMVECGISPAALLFNRVNPILAQGAAFANLALLDRFDGDITVLVRTGDELVIEPELGCVTIL
jgi:predicted aconitase with swiveling domain